MRPFGCPVTILNTLDHLSSFEGKVDEGYKYLINKSGQAGQEKASDHEYILLPFMPSDSPLSSSNQNSEDKDADMETRQWSESTLASREEQIAKIIRTAYLPIFSLNNNPKRLAGARPYRKSITGGCQFLGKRQVLWIQNQMLDYGFSFMNTKIYIDNESTICIVKNPVFHSKTKHIEIRHHFIRDSHEKKLIQDTHILQCSRSPYKDDRQSSKVGFGEMRQLEVLRLILEEISYNWYFGFVNSSSLLLLCHDLMHKYGSRLKFSHVYLVVSSVLVMNRGMLLYSYWRKDHIRNALLNNPTIYVSSKSKQFWQTATIKTVDNGEQEINAIVDGKEFTITEASIGGPDRQETMGNLYMVSSLEIRLKADKEGLWYCLYQAYHQSEENWEKNYQNKPVEESKDKVSDDDMASRILLNREDDRRTRSRIVVIHWILQTKIDSIAGMINKSNILIPSTSGYKVIKLDEEESQRIDRDAEVAQRLQEEFDAAEKQKMAQKLQGEEMDKYSEVDQARMLVDLINQRKRYFTA
ncbi:hypothetical protein Tco_1540310 [Tanacetum coccineum]